MASYREEEEGRRYFGNNLLNSFHQYISCFYCGCSRKTVLKVGVGKRQTLVEAKV